MRAARQRDLKPVEPINNTPEPEPKKPRKPRRARTIEGDLQELRKVYAKRVRVLEDELGKLEQRQRAIVDELVPARNALDRVEFVMDGGKPGTDDDEDEPDSPEPDPEPAEEPDEPPEPAEEPKQPILPPARS